MLVLKWNFSFRVTLMNKQTLNLGSNLKTTCFFTTFAGRLREVCWLILLTCRGMKQSVGSEERDSRKMYPLTRKPKKACEPQDLVLSYLLETYKGLCEFLSSSFCTQKPERAHAYIVWRY